MDIVADFQPERTNDPPPGYRISPTGLLPVGDLSTGDHSTQMLIEHLLYAAERNKPDRFGISFLQNGVLCKVDLNDIRRELQRREQLGMGVRHGE